MQNCRINILIFEIFSFDCIIIFHSRETKERKAVNIISIDEKIFHENLLSEKTVFLLWQPRKIHLAKHKEMNERFYDFCDVKQMTKHACFAHMNMVGKLPPREDWD